MDAKSRGIVLAVATLVSVFMAGALTATVIVQLTRRPAARMAPPSGEGRPFGPPGERPMWRGELMAGRFLAERLELSDDQRAELEEILARRQAQTDAMLEELRPRLRANLDSTQAEIRALLTPAQAERFDRLQREGRARLFERFPPGPRGFREGRGPP